MKMKNLFQIPLLLLVLLSACRKKDNDTSACALMGAERYFDGQPEVSVSYRYVAGLLQSAHLDNGDSYAYTFQNQRLMQVDFYLKNNTQPAVISKVAYNDRGLVLTIDHFYAGRSLEKPLYSETFSYTGNRLVNRMKYSADNAGLTPLLFAEYTYSYTGNNIYKAEIKWSNNQSATYLYSVDDRPNTFNKEGLLRYLSDPFFQKMDDMYFPLLVNENFIKKINTDAVEIRTDARQQVTSIHLHNDLQARYNYICP